MTGFNGVLVDSPHWVASARPVKQPAVAALALQPQPAEVLAVTGLLSSVLLCGEEQHTGVSELPGGFSEEERLK